MAFNRLLDAEIDARNPRTKLRHIPAGLLSRRFAWSFTEVRIGAARKIVNQVMYIFERPKKVIAFGAAAKSEKALDLKDALDVFRSRVSLEDEIFVSAGPAISGPQRIHPLQLSHY